MMQPALQRLIRILAEVEAERLCVRREQEPDVSVDAIQNDRPLIDTQHNGGSSTG